MTDLGDLQIEIIDSSRDTVNGLEALANSLNNLKRVTAGLGKVLDGVNFTKFSSQMKQLSTALQPLQGFKTQATGLLNALRNFKQTAEELNSFNAFTRFAEQIKQLADSLLPLSNFNTKLGATLAAIGQLPVINQQLSTMDFSAFKAQITSLAQSFSPLETVKGRLGATLNQLSRFGQVIQNLETTLRTVKVSDTIVALVRALEPLTQLGKSGLGSILNQLKKIPDVMTQLKGVDMGVLTTQMQQLADAMRPLANEMQKIANGFAAFPARIQRLIAQNQKLSKSFNLLGFNIKSVYAKFSIMYLGFKRVASIMGEWLKTSNSYVENLNLFRVTMRGAADEALAYAESVQEAFGIDVSEWIRYQAVFHNMATGFGITSEKAAVMSKTLTQLGYDLATIFNTDYATAMEKLESAISGQPRPMREWGFDLSEATLKLKAMELGITKNVETMTQYEKAQLRFIHLMDTARKQGILGNFSREIITPANAMRILNQRILQLRRALGNLLIPILMKVLPYLQAFVILLNTVIQRLATFFKFEIPKIDYSGLDEMAGIGDEISDGLDEATNSANELRKALAPIDDLNIISEPKIGAGGGIGGGAGIGNGIDLDLSGQTYEFLTNIENKAKEIAESLQESFESMLEAVTLIGLGLAAWKVSNSVMGAINWFKENSKQGKLALGITMAITGFTLASSGWIEIGKGDASIQDALKAAIGTALGVAGTALALGGGPAGWTVGILAGLAVSVISLTVGYERSLKTLVRETFLNADGAISISDVVVRFDNLMVEITGGMDSVIMASQNIQSLKDNVSGANDEIFKIASAWANGVISTEKAVPQLIEIIGGLKTDTKTILDEIYNNIVEAIGGSFGNALIEAGYSTDEVLQLLKEIRGESEVSIDSLVTSLEELETQLQSGEITANEFETKYAEIQTQLEKLIGKTDLTSGAFDGLYGSLEKIDWSSIKDSGEITSFIEEIATSTETAKNKIDEYYGGIISGLETLRENVEDPEKQVEIDRWIKVAKGARDEDKRQIDENLQELVDYIQWDVSQKIPVIAENAENDWDEFSPVKKFIFKKDTHVQNALDTFEKNVVDPLNNGIAGLLEGTGDEQAGNAAKARDVLLNGLYDLDKNPTTYVLKQDAFKRAIRKDMNEFLNSYTDDATGQAKTSGGAIIEGQYEGAKSKLETLKEVWSKLFKTIGSIFDRDYKIESPSKVFKEKGENLVQGLWDGMTEIWNKLKSWWDNLSLPELKFKMPRFSWNSDNGIKATGALKTILEFLNLPTSIPKLQVSWYAAGGFPDMGELFVAREAGPELVGRIGGRTAVVSNQDIVAAVSQGVESAVRRAYSGGAGANSNPVVYVYVGDEQVAAHVEKANRFNTMRTNGR